MKARAHVPWIGGALLGLAALAATASGCGGEAGDAVQDHAVRGVVRRLAAPEGAEALRVGGSHAVRVPAGAVCAWNVAVPPGGAVRFAATLDPHGEPLELEVELAGDGAAARTATTRGAQGTELPLGDLGPFARVSLRAPGKTDAIVVAPVLLGDWGAPDTGSEPERPSLVVLYVVDTLRADRVGALASEMGGSTDRDLTPNLDALAAESLVFPGAVAASSWTRPALATLLTGLAPERHRVLGGLDALAPNADTLSERLHAAGFATAAFVTNANVSKRYGFDQGWDVFEHLRESLDDPRVHRPASEVHARGLEWLDSLGKDERAFLLLHVTDPHGPYVPSAEMRARFAPDVDDAELGSHKRLLAFRKGEAEWDAATARELSALYDAEVAELDAEIGRFLDALRTRGALDRALFVLTADHGEEFGEHGGLEHGRTLFEEQLSVPLFVRTPAGEAGVVRGATVGHADVMPTILRRLGLNGPPDEGGAASAGATGTARDLVALASGETAPPAPAFAHLDFEGRRLASVRVGVWKLIAGDDGERLFDLAADPGEQAPLPAAARPIARAALRELLAEHARDAAADALAAPRAQVDPELERALNAIGY